MSTLPHAWIDHAALGLVVRWPQLANPAPPEPPSSDCTVERLVAAECFEEPVRLRCPAESLEGLVGPIIGNGPCMEPHFPSGSGFWIDPTLRARDGDLVAVWFSEAEMLRVVERNKDRPGWLETYTDTPHRLAIKLLKQLGDEYYLVSSAGLFPMNPDHHRILGVVRAVAHTFPRGAAHAPVAHCIVNGTLAAEKLAANDLSAIRSNIEGQLTVGTGGVIKSGMTAFNAGTGWWLDYNGGTPRFMVGNAADKFIRWDGTTLTLSGELVQTNNIKPGAISQIEYTEVGVWESAYVGDNGNVLSLTADFDGGIYLVMCQGYARASASGHYCEVGIYVDTMPALWTSKTVPMPLESATSPVIQHRPFQYTTRVQPSAGSHTIHMYLLTSTASSAANTTIQQASMMLMRLKV